MSRTRIQERIFDSFSHLESKVRQSGKLNLLNIHICTEETMCGLLNLLYGYDLKNAGGNKSTEAAFDLYSDTEKICYQITSQNDTDKIKKAIDVFIKNSLYKKYNQFIILTLTSHKKCQSTALDKLKTHHVEGKYINLTDLQQDILYNKDLDKIEVIANFLEKEIGVVTKPKIIHKIDPQLKSKHIVEQMYDVLKPFEGLTTIHPRTIAAMYPFTLTRSDDYSYDNWWLKTDNPDLINLLEKVKILDDGNIECLDATLEPFKEKLRKIFEQLNFSLISGIFCGENKENRKTYKIWVYRQDKNCNCNECLFYDFKTALLFDQLERNRILFPNDLKQALSDGLYLCRIGEFIKGWKVLTQVAEKARKEGKDLLYYIAISNLKNIKWSIPFKDESLQQEIRAAIDQIEDVEDALSDLNMLKNVKKELLNFSKGIFLNDSKSKMEDYARKISDTYYNYNNYHFISLFDDAKDAKSLEAEMYILHYYYAKNLFIDTIFTNFENVMLIGFKGLLMSHNTNKAYNQRYQKFSSNILNMMVLYGDADAIKKFVDKNKMDPIDADETDINDFLELLRNFLTGVFTIGYSNKKDAHKLVSNQDIFGYYPDRLRHTLRNFMYLCSKLNCTDEQMMPNLSHLLDFIDVTAVHFYPNDWEYLSLFISKFINAFSTKQIDILLKLIYKHHKHENITAAMENIAIAAARNGYKMTESMVKRVMDWSVKPCKKCGTQHHYKMLLPYWSIFTDEGQNQVRTIIAEYLTRDFNDYFYRESIRYGIFDGNTHPELLSRYIDYVSQDASIYDVYNAEKIFQIRNFTVLNALIWLNRLKVDFQDTRIQAIAKKCDYYDWYINFEKFDYSNFKLEWVEKFMFIPEFIWFKLKSLPVLQAKIKQQLSMQPNEGLSKKYIEHS